MVIDEAMIRYAEERLDRKRLRKLVLDTAELAWKREFGEKKLEEWLDNFTGKLFSVNLEQSIALWLLLNFTFYTQDEMRELCRTAHNRFLHLKLEEYSCKPSLCNIGVANQVTCIYQNTLFAPLGDPSESGANILVYYRQVNDLPKEVFETHKSHYENLVLIDDVSLSGGQSSSYVFGYMHTHKIMADNIFALTLFSSNEGIQKFNDMSNILSEKGMPRIQHICSIFLDDRCKCFSSVSDMFSHKETAVIQPLVRAFCEHYGNVAIQGYLQEGITPLGHNDGQFLLGFFYNTPNNSLPIFWSDTNGWKPILKRYDKKYELGDTGGRYESVYI